eukprot:11198573-Lingulodinium_polyedra.AAC.1
MAADIFTKGFTDKVKRNHAIRAIGIVKTSKIGKKQRMSLILTCRLFLYTLNPLGFVLHAP